MEEFIVRRYVMKEAKRDIRRSYLCYVAMGRKEKTVKGLTDRPWVIYININWGNSKPGEA